jgi:hypothetical protein
MTLSCRHLSPVLHQLSLLACSAVSYVSGNGSDSRGELSYRN